jgi:hypothetical protein
VFALSLSVIGTRWAWRTGSNSCCSGSRGLQQQQQQQQQQEEQNLYYTVAVAAHTLFHLTQVSGNLTQVLAVVPPQRHGFDAPECLCTDTMDVEEHVW